LTFFSETSSWLLLQPSDDQSGSYGKTFKPAAFVFNPVCHPKYQTGYERHSAHGTNGSKKMNYSDQDSGCASGTTPQISAAYSRMVRSLEK
jgi:hypothetical protein